MTRKKFLLENVYSKIYDVVEGIHEAVPVTVEMNVPDKGPTLSWLVPAVTVPTTAWRLSQYVLPEAIGTPAPGNDTELNVNVDVNVVTYVVVTALNGITTPSDLVVVVVVVVVWVVVVVVEVVLDAVVVAVEAAVSVLVQTSVL